MLTEFPVFLAISVSVIFFNTKNKYFELLIIYLCGGIIKINRGENYVLRKVNKDV